MVKTDIPAIKERILEGTYPLFLFRGIKNLKVDDIASELHLSKRTIYENFPDKKTLVEECCEYMLAKIQVHYDAVKSFKEKDPLLMTMLILNDIYILEGLFSRFHNDLKLYHPAIFERLIGPRPMRRRDLVKEALKKAKENGHVLEWVNENLVASALVSISRMGDQFTAEQFGDVEWFSQVSLLYLRGILTEKGLREYPDFCQTFQEKAKEVDPNCIMFTDKKKSLLNKN